MKNVFDVVIVGTGFGAISAAIMLNKLNLEHKLNINFVMLERRRFAGGTWQQNRYPGAAVDVQSILYSLEDEPYPWTEMFAKQPELADYTDMLLTKHNLFSKIQHSHTLLSSTWLEAEKHWQLDVKHDEQLIEIKTRIVINATGPLSTPLIQEFKNITQFKGRVFHSNDWPCGLDISNKKVAIVGSGASAVQIIPAIIDKVNSLEVFQRTPHWVLPRTDRVFGVFWKMLLKNKWVYKSIKAIIYIILELRVIGFKYISAVLKLLAALPARKHLVNQVADLRLRELLTPEYKIGCKRILLSNSYYPALQKSNCNFHDKNDAIEAFFDDGVITKAGKKIDLDILVFATGYRAADSMVSSLVVGRSGTSLNEQWKEYPRAYLGTSMPNFPNFFVVTGPNTGIGHTSAIYVIESQMRYIKQAIEKVLAGPYQTIEPTEEAEENYSQMIHSEMDKTVWANGGCKSWYQNENGKVIAMFPGFSFSFRRMCKKWKDKDHIYN